MLSEPLACPQCHTALRPAKPVAPGALIQCPKCKTRFHAGDKPAQPAAPDDFASFTQAEGPTTHPRRRGACGPIFLGCLFLLAPLLGAGGVLAYFAAVYWRPAIQAAIQGAPPAVKDKGPDKP